jgi:hypothetical protein
LQPFVANLFATMDHRTKQSRAGGLTIVCADLHPDLELTKNCDTADWFLARLAQRMQISYRLDQSETKALASPSQYI